MSAMILADKLFKLFRGYMTTKKYTPATLVGTAIGDSLGMSFEMKPYDYPELLAWDGSFTASPYHKLLVGQFTDDTQMSMALAESMVGAGEFSPAKAAKAYLGWFTSGDCRGIGGTTRKAMLRLQKGSPWSEAGEIGDNIAGNGTAMRCAPIGVAYRADINNALEIACIDAVITHNAPEPKYGSMAMVAGVALLSTRKANVDNLIDLVNDYLPPCGVKTALTTVKRLIAQDVDPNVAMRIVAGPRGYVIETVAVAFYSLLATKTFEDCVRMAVRSGGDTDTNAAVAGALAGTLYGLEGIPEKYLSGVERLEDLKRLDLNLYGLRAFIGTDK